MTNNSEIVLQKEATDFESPKTKDEETSPLLPRSAWNNQLTYLKLLLKAKQTLDKRGG
ncbi:MAG: hypothetical protein SAK29_08260 [Scytonema sp. PMC 1069.18]|nr:hypothetical protein [Scytonema sp. PMC 1069.18]MEC4880862.1 hypothetical protein [Scytonema sp. PMC 1070.18]